MYWRFQKKMNTLKDSWMKHYEINTKDVVDPLQSNVSETYQTWCTSHCPWTSRDLAQWRTWADIKNSRGKSLVDQNGFKAFFWSRWQLGGRGNIKMTLIQEPFSVLLCNLRPGHTILCSRTNSYLNFASQYIWIPFHWWKWSWFTMLKLIK